MAFNRGHEWNSESAGQKLGPVFRDAWFGKALLPRLGFRSMDEKEALEVLADQVSANQEYRSQVRLLIEYLVVAGLVERDGNMLRATKGESVVDPANGGLEKEERRAVRQPVTTLPPSSTPSATQNRVEFAVKISVDMAEMAGWEAARISAFFAGLAQLLAARGKEE